jgi:hypothetical protein
VDLLSGFAVGAGVAVAMGVLAVIGNLARSLRPLGWLVVLVVIVCLLTNL